MLSVHLCIGKTQKDYLFFLLLREGFRKADAEASAELGDFIWWR